MRWRSPGLFSMEADGPAETVCIGPKSVASGGGKVRALGPVSLAMRSIAAFVILAALALVACKNKDTGTGTDTQTSSASVAGKPSADECKRAFAHWAEVSAKKNGGTKEEKLQIQAGNIESCPKMMSAAGIACFNGLTEADVGTWPSCLGKK